MAMYTNKTRFTGLSGIDTESMVTQLMMAHSQQLYKLQRANTKLQWKQDAYRSVATSLKTFQDKYLSVSNSATSLRMPSNYNIFSAATFSNGTASKAVTAKASGTAAAGNYSMHVLQLATKDTYKSYEKVGDTISTSGFDVSQLKDGDSFAITLDGVTRSISFSEADLKVKDPVSGNYTDEYVGNATFMNTLNSKLEAAFGFQPGTNAPAKVEATLSNDGNKTLIIKTNGDGHTLSISDNMFRKQPQNFFSGTESEANEKLLALGKNSYKLNVTIGTTSKDVTVDLSKLSASSTADDVLATINSALSSAGVSVSFSRDANGLTASINGVTRDDITIKDAGSSENKNLLSILSGGNGDTQGSLTTFTKSSVLSHMGTSGIVSGSSNKFDNNDKIGTIFSNLFAGNEFTMKINNKDITLNSTDTITDMMNKVNNSGAGVTLSYNNISETFTLESNKTGSVNQIIMGNDTNDFLTALKLEQDIANGNTGTDAQFIYQGITTTRESNSFTLDGISFTLNEVTSKYENLYEDPDDDKKVTGTKLVGDPVTIEVTKDVTKVKEMIMGFVAAYNELIKSINDMTSQTPATFGSYTKYEPLTDEEKKEMSEKEIEQWEAKAKEGILSRDSILDNITQSLRTQMYNPVTLSDGTKLSLFQLGITTTTKYSDKGKLEVNEDVLTSALENYGEDLVEFFTKDSSISYSDKSQRGARMASEGLMERVNDIIRGAIDTDGSISQKAGIKGTFTEFSNSMWSQLNDHSDRISAMMRYLADKETEYYNMFSKIESAMSQNDSQMAALQSMLGV